MNCTTKIKFSVKMKNNKFMLIDCMTEIINHSSNQLCIMHAI